MRADLVARGVRLQWVAADEKEEPALAAVMERLQHEGEGILLVYDNTVDADALKPYLPRGGAAQVLVTSNAHAWRGVATPVEIELWPKEIGADYLMARTGRRTERAAAESLSEALGGLPLAHEQAAAYCERLDISFAEYAKKVAVHPAAGPCMVHAAFVARGRTPLFLFPEARKVFDEPLASALADDGLDEAVAALRVFALVDHETIKDERDPSIETNCIRLHRLVR